MVKGHINSKTNPQFKAFLFVNPDEAEIQQIARLCFIFNNCTCRSKFKNGL